MDVKKCAEMRQKNVSISFSVPAFAYELMHLKVIYASHTYPHS